LKYARLDLLLVLVCLGALSASTTLLVNHLGWTLYYGDAEAHLNIARRILDSRTPGYDQIGTSWLPLPHLLALPLIGDDRLWRSGLAGAIPSSVCFVLAGAFLFAAMRRATESRASGFAALGLFVLNPNLLYVQATPMTEPVFLAGLMAVLYFTVLFRDTQSFWTVIGAALASLAASLSRYEGWFLIPFVTIYFLFAAKRWRLVVALIFASIASLAPLYWLGHNCWLYSNPLEFFNGPYSAQAINQRSGPYPGQHDWKKAWLFFQTDARMCIGWGAVILAAAGVLGGFWKRIFWPVLLASLPPSFYLWSMYSGGAAIFVPQLWFGSYYNTRYGLAALPLIAVAGACLTLVARERWRPLLALATIAIGAAPWLIRPQPDQWICWRESQVNSESRRAWIHEAAQVLARPYQRGAGIFTSFGDLTGVLREAGIPLHEALHDGNEPAWMAAATRPNLFLHEEWAIAISGDTVATAVQRATFKTGPRYHLERTIITKGAPVIEIYKRD
jgi:hypothetical protein